jgi:thiamine kinase-like enzyme
VQPVDVVAELWPGRAARVEPLGGGITNHNFKVAVEGESFVLRIGGKDTALLGIDRQAEHAAALAAASTGVGPEVVAFVEPEGYLVTRFVDGEILPEETMRTPAAIRRVAALLRRVHGGPAFPARFDSFRVVETYRDTAAAHGVAEPPGWGEAKSLADRIEAGLGDRPLVPCHNDLLNANFIADGDRLHIVDWEYAGMGDPFFDLANFAVNHGLDEAGDEVLLDAYLERVDARERALLAVMRFMSDFREAMWGGVQQGISELDFDFRAYSEEHFARLGETAASKRFRAALAELEQTS